MRERIAAARARIHIKHVTLVLDNDCIAVENSDVAKLAADYPTNAFEPVTLDSNRAIRFAGPHRELPFDEGTNVMTFEVIHDIESILLPAQSLLNQDASVGIGRTNLPQNCPWKTFLCPRKVQVQLFIILR